MSFHISYAYMGNERGLLMRRCGKLLSASHAGRFPLIPGSRVYCQSGLTTLWKTPDSLPAWLSPGLLHPLCSPPVTASNQQASLLPAPAPMMASLLPLPAPVIASLLPLPAPVSTKLG